MNFQKIFFIFFIFLTSLVTSCKKEKKPLIEKPKINIKIASNKAIRFGELKIYPILNESKTPNDTHMIFAEAVKKRGFNIRRNIEGQGVYPVDWSRKNIFYFANKSDKSSLLLLGDIAQSSNLTYISQESPEIPAKRITDVGFISLNGNSYNQASQIALKPLFPCPPTPLRNLIHNKSYLTTSWLHEALPLLGFPVKPTLKTFEMDLNLFGNDDEKDEDLTDRIPQENIGDLNSFLGRFTSIGENVQATGCIVTYRDTILISYVFAQANLFQKEWPYIATSIYLNQLMGYRPTEMQSFTPFVDVETSTKHIRKLWQQDIVLPKDDAYRGEWDGVPFYLVWF